MPDDEISLDDNSGNYDAVARGFAFSTRALYPPTDFTEEWLSIYDNWRDAALDALAVLEELFESRVRSVESRLTLLRRIVDDWNSNRRNWAEVRARIIRAMVKLNQEARTFMAQQGPFDEDTGRQLKVVLAVKGIAPLPDIIVTGTKETGQWVVIANTQRILIGDKVQLLLLKGVTHGVRVRRTKLNNFVRALEKAGFDTGRELFTRVSKTEVDKYNMYQLSPDIRHALRVPDGVSISEIIEACESHASGE